ncbi:hypothetical protein N7488_004814 [Penicillium malachiteum]|nr:hypothetical protein N7488_004814 [Penicillium malachiteum]
MWHRLNDSEAIYRETAARYFNLILESLENDDLFQTRNILLLALALKPELTLKVLESLYATGWIYHPTFSPRPDFLGAIAISGFFQQVSEKLSKLSSDAPEDLKPSASARLLAFTPVIPEKSDQTKSTNETLEAVSVENSSNDIHFGGESFKDDNAKANDQVSNQPGDGDHSDSGHDESGDVSRSNFDESNGRDFESWLWANSREVKVPLNKFDSDFVLEAIFGNNFAPLQCSGGEAYEIGNLMAPELESRLQQISLRAKSSTLSKLEETLVEAGFLVPREKVPDVWPPSVYEPEFDDEEIRSHWQSESVVLEELLGW